MKNFFRNLSIKSKLLFGFGIIVLIILVSGLRELSVLNNLDAKRVQSSRANTTIQLLKESRLLINYEISASTITLNARNKKEIRNVHKKHLNNYNRLIIVLSELKKTTLQQQKFKYNSDNKVIKDSINDVSLSYTDISNAFTQLLQKKANYIDIDEYYGEHVKLSLQNDSTKILSKVELASSLNEEIIELSLSINGTGYKILRKLKFAEETSENIIINLEEEALLLYDSTINTTFLYLIVIIILAIIISLLISNIIVNPINTLKGQLDLLSEGELVGNVKLRCTDEIGEMSESINNLVVGLKKTSEFSIEIGKGQFDTTYTPLGVNDILGNSLLSMRDSLQFSNTEEEKRKIEDAQRNRTSEGLAVFSEILRKHTENIKDLSNEIISGLVKFMNANQGGIFILNDDDKDDTYLDLLGAYAYNRVKFLKKQIRLGEGLVGSVAIEKYTIYMTDIPNEYIEIESGIGSSNPKSILITPLKMEEEVLGVIELASFNKFEKYEIELVEKIAESIASSLSTARINTRTAMLLEQSNRQAAKMREQEEEMLQNIEELKATQEESDKREELLRKTISEIRLNHKMLQKQEVEQEEKIKELTTQNSEQLQNIIQKVKFSNSLIENSINSIFIIDNDGNVSKTNKNARELLKEDGIHALEINIKQFFPGIIDKNSNVDENELIRLTTIDKKFKSGKIKHLLIKHEKQIVNDLISYIIFIKDITNEVEIDIENTKLLKVNSEIEFETTLKIEALERVIEQSEIDISKVTFDEILRWDNSFSIGIDIIDQQHKKWIKLTNQIYRKFKKNDTAEFIKSLKEFIDYTDYHFGFEEKYMNDFGFENSNEHKNQHKYFIDKIKDYLETVKENDDYITYNTLTFLKFWIKKHIQNEDVKYVDLFIANGIT